MQTKEEFEEEKKAAKLSMREGLSWRQYFNTDTILDALVLGTNDHLLVEVREVQKKLDEVYETKAHIMNSADDAACRKCMDEFRKPEMVVVAKKNELPARRGVDL